MIGKLVHYSTKPVTAIHSVEQAEFQPVGKPSGLWVSAEEHEQNWRKWCESERFAIGGLAHLVTLAPGARVLEIGCAAELDAFDREFGLVEERISRILSLEWRRVAERWQGIVIAPYIWERRLSAIDWYYGWDCASGCIWDAEAVASIELLSGAR